MAFYLILCVINELIYFSRVLIYFRVSETMPLYDILNEFQKGHSHIAVVYKDLSETKELPKKTEDGKYLKINIMFILFNFTVKITNFELVTKFNLNFYLCPLLILKVNYRVRAFCKPQVPFLKNKYEKIKNQCPDSRAIVLI